MFKTPVIPIKFGLLRTKIKIAWWQRYFIISENKNANLSTNIFYFAWLNKSFKHNILGYNNFIKSNFILL